MSEIDSAIAAMREAKEVIESLRRENQLLRSINALLEAKLAKATRTVEDADRHERNTTGVDRRHWTQKEMIGGEEFQ